MNFSEFLEIKDPEVAKWLEKQRGVSNADTEQCKRASAGEGRIIPINRRVFSLVKKGIYIGGCLGGDPVNEALADGE
jgi:hypothetical protein